MTATDQPAQKIRDLPWGALPAEQYILQKWDAASPLTITEQRTKLVRAFVQEDAIGPEFDPGCTKGAMAHTPTPDEIVSILEPWRPPRLRSIAAKHWGATCFGDSFIFLRTYYSGGEKDDTQLREWLESNRDEGRYDLSPDDEWWQVLSDPMFDVDDDEDWDDWRKVYDLLPELAAPGRERGFTESDLEDVREILETRFGNDAVEDDYEEAIMDMAASGNWLLVLDRLAFETGELRLIFCDRKGNVVRESGIDVEETGDLVSYCFRNSRSESHWWAGAGTGRRYGPKGRIMKELMRRVKEAERGSA